MAKDSLAVSPTSSNLVSQLAYLINTALRERCDLSSDSRADYYRDLATLIGLGYTAILAEGSRIGLCRPYIATFLRYRDFARHAVKLETFSHAIAEIVCNAIRPFKVLGHPLYHDEFIAALVTVLRTSDIDNVLADKGIKKMLQELFIKYSYS